jgi:hypothetical protein
MTARNSSSSETTLNEIEHNLNTGIADSALTTFRKAIAVLIDEVARLKEGDPGLQRYKKIFDLLKAQPFIKEQFAQDIIRFQIESSLQQAVLEIKMNKEKMEATGMEATGEDAKQPDINKEALRRAEKRIDFLRKGLSLDLSDLFFSATEDYRKKYVTATCRFLLACEKEKYPSELFKVEYASDTPDIPDNLSIPREEEKKIANKCLEFFNLLITHKEILIDVLNESQKKTPTDAQNQQQSDLHREFVKNILTNPLSPLFVIISGARDKTNKNEPRGTVTHTGAREGCIQYCQNRAVESIVSSSVDGSPLFSFFSLGRG